MTGYSSFLIRCWHLDGGAQRITIEHVQSGERIAVASLDAAARWIGARAEGGRDGGDGHPAGVPSHPPDLTGQVRA